MNNIIQKYDFLINNYKRASLACVARLTDNLGPPKAPFREKAEQGRIFKTGIGQMIKTGICSRMIILDLEEEWFLICELKNGGSIGSIFELLGNWGDFKGFCREVFLNSSDEVFLSKMYI